MSEPENVPARRLLDPAEVLGHGEFVSDAAVLGPGTASRPVVEGGVAFGRPVARRVTAPPGTTGVLVRLPFQLDAPAGTRRYRGARYRLQLTDPRVRVRGIWPGAPALGGPAPDGPATFGVRDDLSLGPPPGPPPGPPSAPPSDPPPSDPPPPDPPAPDPAGRPVIRHPGLLGRVTGRVDGAGCVWELRPRDGESLAAAAHDVFAVLEVPAGVTTVPARLVAEAELTRRWLGRAERFATRPCVQRFELLVGPRPQVRAPAAEPARATPRAPAPVVSTGLASPQRPDRDWPPTRPAAPDTDYLFWVALGDIPAPADSAGPVLTVALFGFTGEIAVTPGAEVGELVLRGDGAVGVRRQPGAHGGGRLYFPVRTPRREGRHRLRVNLYCRQTLLESRLVELDVADRPGERGGGPALRSLVDYTAGAVLDAAELDRIEPVTLSMFLNSDGPGTHGVRYLGSDGTALLTGEVVLDHGVLQHTVGLARAALRRVAWRSDDEWRRGMGFRYLDHPEPDLAADLIELARVGYRVWSTVLGVVADGRPVRAGEPANRLSALRALMRGPGTVEFAARAGAGLVVPLALCYDRPLDSWAEELTTCPDAMAAIDAGAELAGHPCFRGECPYPDDTVVCPGGFWGFRHEIGLPQSVRAAGPAPAGTDGRGVGLVRYAGRPHLVVGVAAEFAADEHPHEVAEHGDAASRPPVSDRAQLLHRLRAGSPHLVYLFCHGRITPEEIPALQFDEHGRELIGPDTFAEMHWATHPLVILNGCHTAAVEPRYALNFVDVLVRRAAAAGVIGTEVTIHRDLAAEFATRLLDGWFAGAGLGAAMRRARLELLRDGNPLGMIYVAYAPPRLRLVALP